MMFRFADGSDYDSSTQRTVTFMAGGDTRENVQITVMDDGILEDQEDFSIELRTPGGSDQEGLLANSSARVTIIDNDSESGVSMCTLRLDDVHCLSLRWVCWVQPDCLLCS